MIFHFLVQVSTWQTLNMDQEKYFRIRLKTIRPDKITNFNIYVRIGDRKLLYIKAGDTLNGEKINELHDKDSGENFFVLESDRQKYRDWIREEINSSQLTPRNKADVLRESSVSLMEDLFANPDVNKALDEAKPIINDFLDFMDAAPQSMGYLLSLSGHDFYTYNHSLDVSIYSLGLGQALNFSRSDLEELGVASLFHDIGKPKTKRGTGEDA
nr:HD domain-containing protein [Pseudobdellovibrionaceae bacterium]